MRYLTPTDCESRRKNNELTIIDVREKYEYQICDTGFRNLPMAEITNDVSILSKETVYAIMCRSGKRAEALVNLLETEYGFKNLYIIEGGLIAWANEINSTLQID